MKKLLAIDVGNSNVKYGLFTGGRLSRSWKHATAQSAVMASSILAESDAPCAMASVSPQAGKLIAEACGSRLFLEVSPESQRLLSNVDSEMGADRIADAVAAHFLYGKPGKPTIAFSFGTASTALAVDANARVAGGWIAPGVTAQLEVLHERCALLPLLKMENPGVELGTDTETHMRNGVFISQIGAAREWLKAASTQLKSKPVAIATGGWADFLQAQGKVFNRVDQYLTLKGVYLIAANNRAASTPEL